MPGPDHPALTGLSLHEAFHYVQTADPGVVGAGKYWLDTTVAPFALRRRNAANTGWDVIGSVSAHAHAAADITSGIVAPARLGTGTADATTFLKGDSTYGTPPSGMTNPMTTPADLIVGGAAGAPARLAKGTSGQVLTVDPGTGLLVWTTPASGGMADPTTTKGDLLARNTTAVTRLPVGANGQVLTADSVEATGVKWAASSGGGGGSTVNPLHQKRYAQVAPAMNTTTMQWVGIVSTWATITGTATAGSNDAGPYVQYASAATLNAENGINTGADLRTPALPDASFAVGFDLITAVRHWIGFFGGSTAFGSATPTAAVAAFRYDSVADGTVFWRCVTKTSGGAATETVTTVPVSTTLASVFRVEMTTTSVLFYSNDVLVATHTTGIVPTSTAMYPAARSTTLEAVAKAIRIHRITILSK